jgi:hydroxymethylbilane synthase
MAHRITKRLSASEFPYAVGQGALGIEVREGDSLTQNMIQRIEDPLVRKMCLAERALLRTLQGGCSSPVAVNCTAETPGLSTTSLRLEGMIVHPRGTSQVSAWAAADVGDDDAAEVLGAEVAKRLLEDGGRELLEEISRFYRSQVV